MQNTPDSRITPLLPPEWDNEICDALSAFPPVLKFVQSRWNAGDRNPPGAHILGALAKHPALGKAFLTLSAHVCTASTLPGRARELATLRISWLRHAEYEFAHHLLSSQGVGLTPEDLQRVRLGAKAPGWNPDDALILEAVDELHNSSHLGDATWAKLAKRYDERQLLDLFFLVGCYDMLALVYNAFRISPEAAVLLRDPADRRHFSHPAPDSTD